MIKHLGNEKVLTRSRILLDIESTFYVGSCESEIDDEILKDYLEADLLDARIYTIHSIKTLEDSTEDSNIAGMLRDYLELLTGLVESVIKSNDDQIPALRAVRGSEKQIIAYVEKLEIEREQWKARAEEAEALLKPCDSCNCKMIQEGAE